MVPPARFPPYALDRDQSLKQELLATGVTLFFVSANGGGASNVAIAPYVQPGSGGAVLVGRF